MSNSDAKRQDPKDGRCQPRLELRKKCIPSNPFKSSNFHQPRHADKPAHDPASAVSLSLPLCISDWCICSLGSHTPLHSHESTTIENGACLCLSCAILFRPLKRGIFRQNAGSGVEARYQISNKPEREILAVMKALQDSHLYRLGSLHLTLPCMSCRLCLDCGEGKELLTPCACRGSAGHVHAECLLEWCDHVGEYKKCDVCHQRPRCKEFS